MIKLLTRLLILIAISHSALTQAKNTDDFYVVEMIVFTNELRMYFQEENWPNQEQLNVQPPLLFLQEQPANYVYPELQGGKQQETAYILPLLDSRYIELGDAAQKIRTAGRHRLLSHQAWLQKFASPNKALPIAIQAGRSIHGYDEISGTITLSKNRYLHLESNLWRSVFTNDKDEAADVRLPKISAELNYQSDDENTEEYDDFQQLLEQETDEQQPWVKIVSSMKQKRRIRSQEIHFLDHPLFGIIIQIRPYTGN